MLLEPVRWETDTRYYQARLGRDLFGQLIIHRCWGGKGTRLGGMATDLFDTEDEVQKALQALAKVRARRGYRLVA